MNALLRALSELSLDPETAVAERVAPLLYHHSRGTSPPALKKAYYESAAQNVSLFRALDEVRSHLMQRGITPVAIKGADLATSLYENVALRPMGDLDLWVAPGEVETAEDVLRALEYRPALPEMNEGLTRAIKHARLWVGGRRNEVAIDLHWSLVGHHEDRRARSSVPWLRKRVDNGRLDSTAHLLYLSAHMKLQHYDERVPLLWLCDFYLLSHRSDVDWEELFRAASDFGWTEALARTCEEVRERLRVTLPEPLARLSTSGSSAVPHLRESGPEHAWNELSTLGFRARAALIRGYLLPSPAYVRFRYRPRPAWTWPLYYPLRWTRVLLGGISVLGSSR